MRMCPRSGRWMVATCLAAAVSVSGCGDIRPAATSTTSLPSSTSPTPGTTSPVGPPPAPPPRTVKWIDLQPGECLAEPPPSDPAVVTVTVVDCASPHQAETYLRVGVPVNEAVTDVANQHCQAGFSRYTGRPIENSGFAIAYLIDSDQDRTSNNPYPSTVICLLQPADGKPTTGSAARS
jgi:hypothetical protein